MKTLLTLVTGIVVTVVAHAGGTATFNLSSPSDGCIVAPGELIEWQISVTVSSGDNLGLALAAVDLVQDPANPALFDLPAGTCPADMQDFDRPAGISNPEPGGGGSAYGGTPVGPVGGKNLLQIGGAQNTFGVPGNGIGLDYEVRAGVGQDAAQVLARGSFAAPPTLGAYAFSLENPVANTLDEVNSPPDSSPVGAATAIIAGGSIGFTVSLSPRGDLNCDGIMNFADINPFVLALSGYEPYHAAYPNCNWYNADCNCDGLVNFADINAFVALLSGS